MNTMTRRTVFVAAALVALWAAGNASAQPVFVTEYPSVAYYPPAPVTVTTTRYGVFGLRRATTVTYGYPAYAPAPVVSSYYYAPPVSAYYYAPPVVSSYYYAPPVSTYYAPTVIRTSSYYAPPLLFTYP